MMVRVFIKTHAAPQVNYFSGTIAPAYLVFGLTLGINGDLSNKY